MDKTKGKQLINLLGEFREYLLARRKLMRKTCYLGRVQLGIRADEVKDMARIVDWHVRNPELPAADRQAKGK